MRTLFLFVIIFVQSISFVLCAEDTALEFAPLQDKRYRWISNPKFTLDYRFYENIDDSDKIYTSSRYLFSQIKHQNPTKSNPHSFGLCRLTSSEGTNGYWLKAYVDIWEQADNVMICIQPNTNEKEKIEKLEKYLLKLFPNAVFSLSSTDRIGKNEIQNIEGLLRLIKKQHKSIFSLLGF